MIVRFEGREWEFDEDDIDVRQATVLYMTYKMTLSEWIEGIGKADQRALHFAYWLMLQQNGVTRPIGECNPKIVAYAVAYGDARQAVADALEAEAKPEPAVPTIPSPPGGPPSPEPSTPTAMTPVPLVPGPPPTVS